MSKYRDKEKHEHLNANDFKFAGMKSEDAKAIFLLEHCAERCDGYQKDDTCENCEINAAIKAIDRQIPKKPELKGEYYVCPVCGVYQETLEGNPPYCLNCGQRLLWEVEE